MEITCGEDEHDRKGIINPAFIQESTNITNEGHGVVLDIQNDEVVDQKNRPINQNETPVFTSERLPFMKNWKDKVKEFTTKNKSSISIFKIGAIYCFFIAYIVAAVTIRLKKDSDIDWCDGAGLLIIISVIVTLSITYKIVKQSLSSNTNFQKVSNSVVTKIIQLWNLRFTPAVIVAIVVISLAVFIVIDTADQRERLRSSLGLLVLIFLGFVFSKHPLKIRWRCAIWGFGLQFAFGLLALRWATGRRALECIGYKVSTFLDFSNVGASFVYNHLVDGQPLTAELTSPELNATVIIKPETIGSVFAFKILSVVFFFNFFIQILYYYGVMQWIVSRLGRLLSATVGSTAAESMSTAANVFLAQTEAPLVIKPYLPLMTMSELHTVMSGGFATVAGSVLAAYISYGIEATHLIAASIMAAPGSLAMAKMLYPETKASKTTVKDIKMEKGTESNALDAAAQGAANAVMVVLNICASLIAFLSFIAFVNSLFAWVFQMIDVEGITFVWIITKIFIPLAWCLGVDALECEMVAELIATKNVVNEFAGFSKLGQLKSSNLISSRGEGIATFAMCGFANPGSIGIQLAVIGTMAPTRKGDLARIVIRAFISGSMTSLVNACIAGILLDNPGVSGGNPIN
ncbi:sodium/nucleoside cotransporter 2-like isoform X3 [Artemia franciscana]|uniref:Sodium/nucleoside cotransporter n=1 Tax=Artemia franciscana TaxID=6661 RepID=A0AA88L3I6_ARTSF|nr:hypothetical protein QYM36_016521 [Artemia franciscana]